MVAVEKMAAYASDLNPDEGIWNYLKRVELANTCSHNLNELYLRLHHAARRLRRKPKVILGCISQAGLFIWLLMFSSIKLTDHKIFKYNTMKYTKVTQQNQFQNIADKSFDEYIQANRFKDSEKLKTIQRLIDSLRNDNSIRQTKVILVHSPYPEDSDQDNESIFEKGREAFVSQGCGKSDLFYLLSKHLLDLDFKDCSVISYIDIRKNLAVDEEFYTSKFLDTLMRKDKKLLKGVRYKIIRFSQSFVVFLERVSLLITIAIPAFIGLIGYIIALLGIKSFDYFFDPKNQTTIGIFTSWVSGNLFLFVILLLVGILIWLLYTWGMLHHEKNKEKLKAWKELELRLSKEEQERWLKELLGNNPAQILKRFAPKGHTLILIIDDVELLDSPSFRKLLNLYDEAKKSEQHSLCLILGYNPRSQSLYKTEHQIIRQDLELTRVNDQKWLPIELTQPRFEDIQSWLFGFDKSIRAVELVETLRQTFDEAASNSGILLSFFRSLSEEKFELIKNDKEKLRQEFESYLSRDRQAMKIIIEIIEQEKTTAEGCFEMLKYIMAFKKTTRIRADFIEKAFSTSEYKDFEQYKKILLSDALNLLRLDKSSNPSCYEFRYPYLRALIDTGWKQWRDKAPFYYDKIFRFLSQLPKIEEDPELALEALPSKLSVEVLYRKGEYYYQYYGASDIAYALRYYGVNRGGALGKWLKLCDDAIENQEDLWEFIYWKSESKTNPYKTPTSTKSPPSDTFILDLIFTAGVLYWMNGHWEITEQLWSVLWPTIREKLTIAPDLKERFLEGDAKIQVTLAEMLYQTGKPSHWERATKICEHLVQNGTLSSAIKGKAKIIFELIQYYRRVGAGNYLPPYRFLRPDVSIEQILKLSEDLANDLGFEKLRLLYTGAEAMWQMLLPFPYLLPPELKLDKIEPPEINNNDLIEQLGQILDTQQNVLTTFRNASKSRKTKTISISRINSGDLLLWEGVYFLMRVRHFRLKAVNDLGNDSRLKSKPIQKIQARIEAYRSALNEFESYYQYSLSVWYQSEDLEKLSAASSDLVSDQLNGKAKELSKIEEKTKKLLQAYYRNFSSKITEQAQQRLSMADTVYRQLGYKQGITTVAFLKALISFENSRGNENEPVWLKAFERFTRYSANELGYHLEQIIAGLIVANWAGEHDLLLAVRELQKADFWLAPDHLGFPKPFTSEINHQIGTLIGNMENSPYPLDKVLKIFETSEQNLDKLGTNLPYIKEYQLRSIYLTIHWWLGEIHLRKAQSESNLEQQKIYFDRVEKENNYVIKQARGKKEHARTENLARLVRGRLLSSRGEIYRGYEELEKAYKYFSEEGADPFNCLQSLTTLVRLAVYKRNSGDQKWKEYAEKILDNYLQALVQLSIKMHQQLELISATNRGILYQAIFLLSDILDHKLRWLNMTFDILESLGLYATAILLDEDIREQYKKENDTIGLEKHQKRILSAAKRIDLNREDASFAKVGRVLKNYAKLIQSESKNITNKMECIQRASNVLHGDTPNLELAVEILKQGVSLINWEALESLEEADIEILQILKLAYQRIGSPDKAVEIDEKLRSVESVIQSRDFLILARYYKSIGSEYIWALRIATTVKISNQFSKEAADELSGISTNMLEDAEFSSLNEPNPIAPIVEAVNVSPDTQQPTSPSQYLDETNLINKQINEFHNAECYALLMLLEKKLRSLIVIELEKLTPSWWKQRIPSDTRANAEQRKQKREESNPGVTKQDLPLQHYLDFSDYPKIITMKLNWEDAFKKMFAKPEFVTFTLGNIMMFRNDIAHMRELPSQDRDSFVVEVKKLLRIVSEWVENQPLQP